MVLLICLTLLIVAISAACSLTEAAVMSVPLLKVQQMATKHPTRIWLTLLSIKERMETPIASLVIINNSTNIIGTILITGVASKVFSDTGMGVFTGVLTFSIIMFAEIVPKTIGERHAERIAFITALPVKWLTTILTPIVMVTRFLNKPFTSTQPSLVTVNEDELKYMTNLSETSGEIDPHEKTMIHQVLLLDDVTAGQIMTPRVQMTYLYGEDILDSVVNNIIDSEHSRIIVVGETPDDVLGVIYKTDILANLRTSNIYHPVGSKCRAIHSFKLDTKAVEMLEYFKSSKQHIAIVRDEFNGVAGVVTLEDVLEILVGEIVDEKDSTADLRIPIS